MTHITLKFHMSSLSFGVSLFSEVDFLFGRGHWLCFCFGLYSLMPGNFSSKGNGMGESSMEYQRNTLIAPDAALSHLKSSDCKRDK